MTCSGVSWTPHSARIKDLLATRRGDRTVSSTFSSSFRLIVALLSDLRRTNRLLISSSRQHYRESIQDKDRLSRVCITHHTSHISHLTSHITHHTSIELLGCWTDLQTNRRSRQRLSVFSTQFSPSTAEILCGGSQQLINIDIATESVLGRVRSTPTFLFSLTKQIEDNNNVPFVLSPDRSVI